MADVFILNKINKDYDYWYANKNNIKKENFYKLFINPN